MSITGKLVLRPVDKTMQECLTLLVLITKTNDLREEFFKDLD